MNGSQYHRTDDPRSRLLGGVVLIGIGVFFLFTQMFNISLSAVLWPFFIIVPGLAFLFFALVGGKEASRLAFPGMIVTATGGLLLLMDMGILKWESWAYMWGVYPVAVGAAMVFVGSRGGDDRFMSSGYRLIAVGAGLLVVFGLFFELLIFGDTPAWFDGVSRFILPLALIGGGALLLLRRGLPTGDNMAELPKRKHSPNGRYTQKYPGPSAEVSPSLKRKLDEALEDEEI